MPKVNDPSDRMQVRSLGNLQSPAQCYVCGSSNCDDGYIDFGTFIDYYGSFYLCMTCGKELAETIGYYSPEEVLSTQSVHEAVAAENVELKKELEYARPIVSAFESMRVATSADGSPNGGSTVADATEQLGHVSSPFEGREDREPETPEPFNRSRRTDSRGTTTRNVTFK